MTTTEARAAGATLLELDEAALVVAMTVVPGLYSRNKMFSLFTDERIKRARKRAMALRLAVRQLAGGGARNVSIEPISTERIADANSPVPAWRLVYEMPRVSYARHLLLGEAERACVMFLLERAARAGATVPAACSCRDEDRALVERTLTRLMPSGEASTAASYLG